MKLESIWVCIYYLANFYSSLIAVEFIQYKYFIQNNISWGSKNRPKKLYDFKKRHYSIFQVSLSESSIWALWNISYVLSAISYKMCSYDAIDITMRHLKDIRVNSITLHARYDASPLCSCLTAGTHRACAERTGEAWATSKTMHTHLPLWPTTQNDVSLAAVVSYIFCFWTFNGAGHRATVANP